MSKQKRHRCKYRDCRKLIPVDVYWENSGACPDCAKKHGLKV